jgi:hypothetical protein
MWKLRRDAQGLNLPDEIRVSLRPLIRQLRQDLHRREKIKVTLNLRGVDEQTPKARRVLERTTTETTFDEKLCQLRMLLNDGSMIAVGIDNEYVKLERKGKKKFRWQKLSTVTTEWVPPKRIRWRKDCLQGFIDPATETLRFTEGNGVTAARLERRYIFTGGNALPAHAAPAADIVRMLVRLNAMRPAGLGSAN